jgi:hypothetical protein
MYLDSWSYVGPLDTCGSGFQKQPLSSSTSTFYVLKETT